MALAPVTVAAGRVVLALNSGSSSLKYGLFGCEGSRVEALHSGEADGVEGIVRVLADAHLPTPGVIGHRIVHGGPKLLRHCVVDESVVRELEAASAFAPLHMPAALALLASARREFPHAAHVACFDTAFHADLPDVARVLPVPRALAGEGVRRYGFHGLSCESIVHQMEGELPERLVIAHLGNGASVTAVRRGRSVDTSMGLTPTGGVIMGTRSGDLDPGVLLYLMREKGLDAAALENLLDRRSGLLGISGVASDMRRLHEAAASNGDARLAIEMFCRSVAKTVAAMGAALGGVDTLVFTGGIGENDALVRETIRAELAWLTLEVRVLPSRENEQIARHALALSA